MSDLLFLDIETAECADEVIIQDIADNIKPPGNIKKAESIAKWEKEKKPQAIKEAVSKTSFDGFTGSICSIAWAANDGEVKAVTTDPGYGDEDLLHNFFSMLIAEHGVNFNPRYVAHNIAFDLPFLYKRCVVNSIKPTIHLPVNPKPWNRDVFCTMYESVGDKPGGSLNRISKILGLGQKTAGMSGADVNQYFIDGRIDEIVEYNKMDVELCRSIYKRLNFIDKISN